MRARPGAGLLELVIALVVVGVAAGLALPTVGLARDRWAVRTEREAVAALLVRARAEAPGRGGTRLEIDATVPLVRLWSGEVLLAERRLGERGVELDLGSRDREEIVYDALGLGRVASRTVVFRRGGAQAVLVVSSYGRVRR